VVKPVAGSTLAFAQSGMSQTEAAAAGPAFWEHELRRLAARGFAAVDFVDSWFPIWPLEPAQLGELRTAIAAAGLELAGVSFVRSSPIDPTDSERNLAQLARGIEAAAALGAPIVSIGFHRPLTPEQERGPFWMHPAPTDDRGEKTWQLAADRVRLLADRCVELGLALTLELHEGTLLADSDGALRVLELVDRDNVGINPDIGNLVRVPGPLAEDPLETIERCGRHINYWHVKNYVRLEHPATGTILSAPCALGEGAIDYSRAIGTAHASGYTGPYCVEHYGGDPLWAMEQGRRYLDRLLEDVA
jgi:sugar phosphate isomerase/epimerase